MQSPLTQQGKTLVLPPAADGGVKNTIFHKRRFTMSDLSQIIEALSEPFPSTEVEFKTGALNKEKTKALALAYVDSRSYIARLNLVAPEWQDDYQVTVSDRVIVLCRLTIAGVTRTGDGECLLGGNGEDDSRTEPNALTTASAQAFKRACVKFGLGAYLYALPQVWCDYDHAKRKIVNPPRLPEWALSPAERMEKGFKAAQNRVAQEMPTPDQPRTPDTAIAELYGESPSPAPAEASTNAEPANPGEAVVHFGKMAGKTLAQVWAEGKGQGWVRWCANVDGKGFDPKNDPKNVHLQRMARAFLSLNAAYAG